MLDTVIGDVSSTVCCLAEIIIKFMTEQPYLGDIIMLKIPGQAFIALNSAQAVSDLFEKRSRQYSGRPYIPMVMESSLYASNMTLTPLSRNLPTGDSRAESTGPGILRFYRMENAGDFNAS